jgi:hydroxymethylglutaryl-CoA lyase
MMVPDSEARAGGTIHLVEVGPRDGLQNESAIIPTDVKVALVDLLSASGLTEIEVTSFVSPGWVPQLADGDEVFRRIQRRAGVVYSALVPNQKGLDRALGARVDKIAVFTAASETFAQRNINATIEQSIERFRPVLARATCPVRGYVSTAFHCPFEGPVSPEAVIRVALALREIGCSELSIGDTIGRAAPDEVRRLLDALLPRIPRETIALHFHDTAGRALLNVQAAVEYGIRIFDGSVGGVGGCPYAPGAPGNVATQALVRALHVSQIDLSRLDAAADLLTPHLGHSRADGLPGGSAHR